MFTGIVERTARVVGIEDRPGSRLVTVEIRKEPDRPPWADASLGESISVSGVCLTVVAARSARGGQIISFEAVPETLEKTTLGGLKVGDLANIERSLRAGDLLGGHYVTGHVDGVGSLRSMRRSGDQIIFEVEVPEPVIRQVIPKGSVAVDGISLTVVDVDRKARTFTFAAIPHTLAWTTLSCRAPGARLNIETDALGKWVLHGLELAGYSQVSAQLAGGSGKTVGDPSPAEGAEERLQRLLAEGGYAPEGRDALP